MPELNVMTFNIRGAPDRDIVNAWENRADLNLRTLQRYTPDLIGFQEVQNENLEFYRRELSDYAFVTGVHANRAERILHNAIFWKPERLSLRETGGFFLNLTPERWALDWDSARVRAATYARFVLKDGEGSLFHLNTHLDHLGQQARLEGTRLIIRKITGLCQNIIPVILTGDFNSSPVLSSAPDEPFAETPYGLLRAAGFEDAFALASNSELSNTYHDFRGEAFVEEVEPNSQRMDWIMILNGGAPSVQVTSYKIIRDAKPPLYPSDHYPVLARLELTAPSQ